MVDPTVEDMEHDSVDITKKIDDRPANLKFSFVEIEGMPEDGTPCEAIAEEYHLFKVLKHLLPAKEVFLGVRHKQSGFSFSFLQQVKYGSSKTTSVAHYFLAMYLPGEKTVEEGDSPPFMCLLLKVQEYCLGSSESIFCSLVEEVPLSALGLQTDTGPSYVKTKQGKQIAPMSSRFGDEILARLTMFLQSPPEQRPVHTAKSRNEIVAAKAAERDRKTEEAEKKAAEKKADQKRSRAVAGMEAVHHEVKKEKKFKIAATRTTKAIGLALNIHGDTARKIKQSKNTCQIGNLKLSKQELAAVAQYLGLSQVQSSSTTLPPEPSAATATALEIRFSNLEAGLATNIKELHESKQNIELHSTRITKLECDSANILASCKIMQESILSMKDTMKCDKDTFENHIAKVQDQVSINESRARKSLQAVKEQGEERANDLYEFLQDNHKRRLSLPPKRGGHGSNRKKRFQSYGNNDDSDNDEF